MCDQNKHTLYMHVKAEIMNCWIHPPLTEGKLETCCQVGNELKSGPSVSQADVVCERHCEQVNYIDDFGNIN